MKKLEKKYIFLSLYDDLLTHGVTNNDHPNSFQIFVQYCLVFFSLSFRPSFSSGWFCILAVESELITYLEVELGEQIWEVILKKKKKFSVPTNRPITHVSNNWWNESCRLN